MVTGFIALLLVLGLLSSGWLVQIRDWIKAKVREA